MTILGKLAGMLQGLATALDGPGLFLVAILDSSFLSIPEGNDILIVMLSIGKPWGRMAYYVAMTTLGSILGCLALYTVGRKGGNPLLKRRFSPETVAWAEKRYERFGVLTVVVPSILPPPTPFKVFVLIAGVFELPTWEFIGAVAVGRTIRYAMWGVLAVLYGQAVKEYMQQNLTRVGIVLFALLLVTLLVIGGFYIRKLRARRRAA
jgi:membrane protein YqaA with SNARE-associated domain